MTTPSHCTSSPATFSRTGQQAVGRNCVSGGPLPPMATDRTEFLPQGPERDLSAPCGRTVHVASEEAGRASSTPASSPSTHGAVAEEESGSAMSLPTPPARAAAPVGATTPQLSEAAPLTLVVAPSGTTQALYDERLDLSTLGSLTIERASHVEPVCGGRWTADLTPVGGPVLGPFGRRSDALTAETQWIDAHLLS